MSRFANKVTGIVGYYFTIADFIISILNFGMMFQKKYNERFIASQIVDIINNVMDSFFLKEVSAQYYYGHIRAFMIMFKLEGVHALIKNQIGDDANLGSGKVQCGNANSCSQNVDERLCKCTFVCTSHQQGSYSVEK